MTTESDGLLTYGKRQSFFVLFCINRLFQFPFLRHQNFCPDDFDRFLRRAISCKRICITRAKSTSRKTIKVKHRRANGKVHRTANSANSSHCTNSANSEQCERFILSEQCEQRTVRTVHFLKIVEQGEQCEQVRTLFGGACRG